MLVLQRKKDQQIVIDGNIVVTVVEIHGGTIRLGIEAPREVAIHRREVHDAIQGGRSVAPAPLGVADSAPPPK